MTIAIAINTNEGAVLASDSATTMTTQQGQVFNIYNNANKLFNLCKGSPIGVATYGAGSIGPYGIGLLAKEFREVFQSRFGMHADSYQLHEVAAAFKKFMFDEYYEEHYPAEEPDVPEESEERDDAEQDNPDDPQCSEEASIISLRPQLGFILTGFSSGEKLPETYVIETDGRTPATITKQTMTYGPLAKGMPEAVERLCLGFSGSVINKIQTDLELDDDATKNLIQIALGATIPLVIPSMPLQDAIDLARFLVDLTINYQRFLPGDKTVGGPVEVATMTRYEGFKWITRKHYFDRALNPTRREIEER